ncbi:MAG: hypothetical protein LQ350_007273 [Teloschistes chrysophthalmus]|nr:MAG: hypothetical protein LQ350_007273 [Niorma chrysophthalma]
MASTNSPTAQLAEVSLHSYHCLCSTHLLTTPYLLSSLPLRAPPAHDHARILPLPPFPPPTNTELDQSQETAAEEREGDKILPSLLSPNLKTTRKPIVIQREDGWEKRRIWRCGRCGLGIGYEVLGDENSLKGVGEKRLDKTLFLLEEGLLETGQWEI